MKFLTAVLILLLLMLQYKLWVADDGWAEVHRLQQALETQHAENETLRVRNSALQAEVDDLKQGLAAIEERARTELGMIKEGETFFQIMQPAKPKEEVLKPNEQQANP